MPCGLTFKRSSVRVCKTSKLSCYSIQCFLREREREKESERERDQIGKPKKLDEKFRIAPEKVASQRIIEIRDKIC